MVPELDEGPISQVAEILDDKGVRQMINNLNWNTENSYKPLTTFWMARGMKNLYIRFSVRGNYLRAVNTKDGTSVKEDSCVGAAFYNKSTGLIYDFAFNCIGTAKVRVGKESNAMQPISIEQYQSICRFADLGQRAFFEMEGMFSWSVTVAIPFKMLDLTDAASSEITGNFYKRADGTTLPHYLSWSPIKSEYPDFLLTEFFGEIKF